MTNRLSRGRKALVTKDTAKIKKGTLVEVRDYDPNKEKWSVYVPGSKQMDSISRRYLTPLTESDTTTTITPQPSKQKTEDDAVVIGYTTCIDSECSEMYTTGETYAVLEVTKSNFPSRIINKFGNKWYLHSSHKRFSKVRSTANQVVSAEQTPVPTHNERNTFKRGDKVRFIKANMAASFYGSVSYYTESLEDGGIYTVTVANAINTNIKGQDKAFIEIDASEYLLPYDCFELVVEEPKPIAPAPKKSDYTIKVLCNNNMGYLDMLTVGKTYMAKTSTNRGEDDMYMIETNDRDDKPGYTIAFKHRFIEVKDEPKVGDTLSADWLNSETPKAFHGYTNSWRTEVIRCFCGDREIEKIEEKDGRMAALISGTCNIWIDLDSIKGINTVPERNTEFPIRAICRDNDAYATSLTVGKEYSVKVTGKDLDFFTVYKNDKGRIGQTQAFRSRFEIVDADWQAFIAVGSVHTHNGDRHAIEYHVTDATDTTVTLSWKTERCSGVTTYKETHVYIKNAYENGSLKLVNVPKPLHKDLTIGGYTAKFNKDKVSFGCQTFTLQEVETLLKLTNDPVNATIEIHGTELNNEFLVEIIKQIIHSKNK